MMTSSFIVLCFSGEYLRFGEMTEAANKFEIPVVAASASKSIGENTREAEEK